MFPGLREKRRGFNCMDTMKFLYIFGLICMLGASGEPQYSEHHFNDMPLARMSSAEAKVTALQKHVDDGLAEMRATLKTLQTEYSSQMSKQTQLVEHAVDQLKSYERDCDTQPVAFLARGLRSSHLSAGQDFVFPHLLYSYGNDYNSHTGVFTAPREGLYLFTVNLCAHNLKYVCVEYLVNGVSMSRSTNYSHAGWTCSSLQLVVVLHRGARVNVRATYSSVMIVNNPHRWNTFSGALVQEY